MIKRYISFFAIALYSLFALSAPALAEDDLCVLLEKAKTQSKVRIIVRVDESAINLGAKEAASLSAVQTDLAQIFAGVSYIDRIATTDLMVLEVSQKELQNLAKNDLILSIHEDAIAQPLGGAPALMPSPSDTPSLQ